MHAIRILLLLLLTPAMAVAAGPQRTRSAAPVDLELVLAVDVSDSMDKGEAALQRAGYRAAITDPGVLAAIRAVATEMNLSLEAAPA